MIPLRVPDNRPAVHSSSERVVSAAKPPLSFASSVAVLATTGFIAFLRRPDMVFHPQFWGEDSNVLFL